MEDLLQKLAKLSLKKAGGLSKQAGGLIGGAYGGPAGAAAGQAAGGTVKSLLDTLAESGESQYGMQGRGIGNMGGFQQRPSFAGRLAGNFGNEMGQVAGDQVGNMLGGGFGAPEEELSVAQQLEELLDSLTPEERASILAKYSGAQ